MGYVFYVLLSNSLKNDRITNYLYILGEEGTDAKHRLESRA
jgi:hypothetical protein